MVAAASGHLKVVELLIVAKAQIDILNKVRQYTAYVFLNCVYSACMVSQNGHFVNLL